MDINDIIQTMNGQAEQIAKYLLPAGRVMGKEFCAGSIHGEAGQSLKVCISGGKVGMWSDFAAGDMSGDLLDLWRVVRGLSDNKTALTEIKDYLGIKDPTFCADTKKEYRRPTAPKGAKKVQPDSPVLKYLTGERKLTKDTITLYQVAEMQEVGPWVGWKTQKPIAGPWMAFPYKRDGELLGVKYLHLERKEGKKFTLVESGCEPCCFGWHTIDPTAREITICEGEIDAMTLAQYGFPAVSVPFGGGKGEKQQWVGNDWEQLERFDTIYLCMDNDKEGKSATDELISRLGCHRCRIVTLPCKDANKCLQDGIPPAEIAICFSSAKHIEPEELKRADFYSEEVINEFYPPAGKLPGFDTPWSKCTLRFLRGELTCITGINGHGKSVLWGQILLEAVDQGETVCIASLEMSPRKTLSRMVRQATGKAYPPHTEIRQCLQWMGGSIWLFDLVGTGKVARLLEVFEYAFRRHGVKQFLIDSLMKCGIAEDDYKGQKHLVETLCDFCSRTGAHIHLVTHARKGENELSAPGKMDIKGTGAISDLAFNTVSVWRNKRKENIMKAYENNEPLTLSKGETLEEVMNQPDVVLSCDKSRNVEDAEGKYLLWFDKPSLQYKESPGAKTLRYYKVEEECPY